MLNRRDFISGTAAGIGAATVMASGLAEAADPAMSLNVIYPVHEGAKFDVTYYKSTHIPLAMKVMKATKVTLIEGVPMGTTAAPFAMLAHFTFASAEALTAGRNDPGMAEVRADIPKFTDIKPTVWIGKTS